MYETCTSQISNKQLATRNSWLANLELAWLMKPSRQLSILSGEGSEPRENPRANGKGARGCDRLGDSFRVQRACLLSYYPNGELARTLDQFYHINVRKTKHSVRKNGSKVVIYNCMVRCWQQILFSFNVKLNFCLSSVSSSLTWVLLTEYN